MQLPHRGRRLLGRIPEPVRAGLQQLSRRSAQFGMELFAGIVVLAGVALFLAYDRLNKGPISLAFLVPTLETAINRELADVVVKIDDVLVRKGEGGSGVVFRLGNLRLIDSQGSVVARAPLAAIGLSGRALLSGRVAPGRVDLIGPRLILFYNPDSGLALTFSRNDGPGTAGKRVLRGAVRDGDGAASGGERVVIGPRSGMPSLAPTKQIYLTRTIAAAFERARLRTTASSYLDRFGVRDAVVVFDQDGKQSLWRVPDFAFDLDHRQRRSILIGQANISSQAGPWRFNFRTEQSEKQERLSFTAFIQDLVPSGIADKFPQLGALKGIDLPISAETSFNVSSAGDLLGAEVKLRLSAGLITVPWDHRRPMLLDEGDVHVRYRASDDRIELLPSILQWGGSSAKVSGTFEPVKSTDGRRSWRFRLSAEDSVLGVEEFGVRPMPVDEWFAEGTVTPEEGLVVLSRFRIRAGAAYLELQGQVKAAPGSPEVKLTGRLSPMSLSELKRFWPKFLASGAREWVGERVSAGRIEGGTVRIDMPGGVLAKVKEGGDIPAGSVALDLRMDALDITYLVGMPMVRTGPATMKIRGRRFVLEVPNSRIDLPSGKRISLNAGRFEVADLRPDPELGEITFELSASADAALELMDQKPLEYAKAVGVKPSAIGGQANGQFKINLPLTFDLEYGDLKIRGRTLVTDASATGMFGPVRVEGGTVNFNVTERSLDARGDILINGVPSLLSWQRIFGAPADKQPDLRVSTVLDEAAREQLGVSMNHAVRGPVPVVLTMSQGAGDKRKAHVQADLRNADVIVANMGWRKEPARAAIMNFDIAEGKEGRTELQNFKVVGDDIAIDGGIALGSDHKPVSFYFPDLSFNVITHVQVAGQLREDNVWQVDAQGSAYDGRRFFKSLFSAGQLAEDQAGPPESAPGLELTAKIGAMVGFFDTTIRDLKVNLQKHNGRLSKLEASGSLNGESPIAVRLRVGEDDSRVMLAESGDAGAAFRLVGFYPRMDGGEASLQVNLDGGGGAGKTGVLWARNFNILGDPVVNEVISTADQRSRRSGRSSDRRATGAVQRQKFFFDQLHVPFSVGDASFTLHDSYINGPQLGATMRGNVDFKSQQVNLGGTYIPLYGLNSVFGSIPIIGDLLVGRRGEGVFGITFAIQGPSANPNVRVNPVSMVAPGIFRQIFEYNNRYPLPVQPQQPTIAAQPVESFSFPQN